MLDAGGVEGVGDRGDVLGAETVDSRSRAAVAGTVGGRMVRARSCCPYRNYWRNWPPSCRRRASTSSDTKASWPPTPRIATTSCRMRRYPMCPPSSRPLSTPLRRTRISFHGPHSSPEFSTSTFRFVAHAEGACASSQRSPRRPLYGRFLEGVGLPAEPPLIASGRPPPHQSLDVRRRLKNSNSNAVCHRRHAGDLRSKNTPPTL